MKALKLIIIALLVFTGEKLMAQNIIINNNTWLAGGSADFFYNPPCTNFVVPFVPFSSTAVPYVCAANPTMAIVIFNDPSCTTPPNPFTIALPTAPLPFSTTYTGCNGVIYTFKIDHVGSDWVIDIN
jgi:hypothetical protein